jgi:hypothetical protein
VLRHLIELVDFSAARTSRMFGWGGDKQLGTDFVRFLPWRTVLHLLSHVHNLHYGRECKLDNNDGTSLWLANPANKSGS